MNSKPQSTMDEETKLALEMSIKHWRENVRLAKEGEEFGYHTDDCALCRMFYNENTETCTACPVRQYTGQELCKGTPWQGVSQVAYSFDPARTVPATKRMLEFLIGLRPKRKRKVMKGTAS